MFGFRVAGALLLAEMTVMAMPAPASAQFFLKSRDVSGTPVRGDEPGIFSQQLPGATEVERRAALSWTLRAALNVAALQCQFEPTLLTVNNYNAILTDHSVELKTSFDTLTRYFERTARTKAAGQQALDQFSTRTYSSVTPVAAQLIFCQTAHAIGRDLLFTPRGGFARVAEGRMRELRNALVPWGEQRFPRYARDAGQPPLPRLDTICWNGKAEWQEKKCGIQNWPPAGTGLAAR